MKLIKPLLAAAILAGSAAGLWRWLARNRNRAFPLTVSPEHEHEHEDDDGADLSCASEIFPAQRRRDLSHLRCHLAPLLLLVAEPQHIAGLLSFGFLWGALFGWCIGLIVMRLRDFRRTARLKGLLNEIDAEVNRS